MQDRHYRQASSLRRILILWAADHTYDLHIKCEDLTETLKKNEGKKITTAVSLEDEHTAEEVSVMAIGPVPLACMVSSRTPTSSTP